MMLLSKRSIDCHCTNDVLQYEVITEVILIETTINSC